ncbi:hypothetical protein OIU79_002708 [Salix purpurea]|uniref:Uncharacterized protein n=1 Tax=Salix purpurea TaxID=77065 RepID=A0A9Q0UKD9_SALPP|nr:hypothetical protein OIU79_002708 [Salix purpurea]
MAAGFLLHLRLCYLVRPWFRLSEGSGFHQLSILHGRDEIANPVLGRNQPNFYF